jgi:signal transduction histidine kinase
VEDEYLVSEMVKGLLEELGYTVVGEATTGKEAVGMTEALRPDIVLMDIRIPELDGIEATRRIHDQCPTPVVVLTSYESGTLVQEASEAGVGAYLIKPPNARELERAITVAMARFEDMMALRALNEDLKRRNEELDAFTYIVAHDLQNPLANIIGFAEVLGKHHETIPPEELTGYLEAVERIGRKMSDTIEQLLLLARSHTMDVELKPLDMGSIVDEALSRLVNMIERYEAEIVLPEAWPRALGYGPWVEQVWFNYLSNAIKYGGDPPRVSVGGIRLSDEFVRFWVRDDGGGISADDQDALFTPFTRLEAARDRGIEGHGLGLAIVRRILEKLGGEAEVESAVGHGSTFAFTLPAAPDQASG